MYNVDGRNPKEGTHTHGNSVDYTKIIHFECIFPSRVKETRCKTTTYSTKEEVAKSTTNFMPVKLIP